MLFYLLLDSRTSSWRLVRRAQTKSELRRDSLAGRQAGLSILHPSSPLHNVKLSCSRIVGSVFLYPACQGRPTTLRGWAKFPLPAFAGAVMPGTGGIRLHQTVSMIGSVKIGFWRNAVRMERAEHVCSARVVQTSTCSAMERASSTSMPRYLTVLSIFLSPARAARRANYRYAGRSGLPWSV